MRNNAFREVHGDKRDVFDAIQMLFTGGDHGFRFLLDYVIHNRQIMGSQVPDYVHIVLEQAQIHAQRIVIVKITQFSVVHHLANFFHGASEQKRVIHHDFQVFAVG